MTPREPELTAVVVVGQLRERAGGALRSLLDQGQGERLEVLLVDLAPAGSAPVPGSDHPAVRIVPLPESTTFARARSHAVGLARAPVTAFVEEHVRVLPGWAEALIAAHRGLWAGVGGKAVNANPGVGSSDIAGLIGYGYWYPPLARGEAEILPGHNASFKTDVLRSFGEELPELLVADLILHQRLRADGHRLLVEPAARFAHLNESNWHTQARGLHLWYRCYGPTRARAGRWSRARRWLYIAAAPVIPLYFAVGFGRLLRRQRPQYLRLFLTHLPYVLAVHLAAASGQALGLLFGPGRAPWRFTRYELTAERRTAESFEPAATSPRA